MKRYIPAVLLMLCGADAFADSNAVEATTFGLGATAGDTYTSGDRDGNIVQLNADAIFPIMRYVGASLSGSYGKGNVGRAFRSQTGISTTAGSSTPSADIEFVNVNAEVFVRNPDIGRVGLRYGVGRERSEGDATFLTTGTNQLETKTVSASAEYYLSRVTLTATGAQTDLEGTAEDFKTAELVMSVYPTDNLRLSLSAGGLDREESYGFGLNYQPRFLFDSTSLLLNYVRESHTIESHFVMIGFATYFGAKGDLIAIDRRYR